MANLLILNQFKGNNCGINDAILISFMCITIIIMINIQLKFQEILYIGYFDTAQFDNLTHFQGQ